ncbi:plasmid partitioning protein RepB [Limobrevibacterium gyesilva]|uniref:Plasmid partitioning protein RepB n=1 Tax=Limobrevibacterium gyesilva TaxID=2991712 RepID=A0AA41YP06_9PROT|nr:plasmid partitioning protein RepB [Limobrevibacterium gyesilva]MCW3476250.1 plasmid partitioning protein RepB [Limobrevibacterium gyesilva]
MKRRDVVRALLTPDHIDEPDEAAEKPARIASPAVRAMGLEIGRLTDEAREAAALRKLLESGDAVVALDPALVDPSFVSDRLSRTSDGDYRRLVESMRDTGQQVPILVRPHPAQGGRYQIAYGHRRREAAAELGLQVKAIVRTLSDAELIVAQGKENAERRNLSFIERALFAAHLQAKGFDRSTLNAALGVHTAEMTRFLAVAAAVPADIVRAIGPAPKAGRPRWMQLATYLDRAEVIETVGRMLAQLSFRQMSTDRRFDAVMAALRQAAEGGDIDVVRNRQGDPVIHVGRSSKTIKFTVDERVAPMLGQFILQHLPELVQRFEDDAAPS